MHDGHQTLVAVIVTGYRRALPVAAMTMAKDALTVRQNTIETISIRRLRPLFPPDCLPILLADRGFGCVGFLSALEAAGWRYVIRLTGDRWVDTPDYTGCLFTLRV